MKVRPFDILYPSTSEAAIRSRLDTIITEGANTVIFYIEEEQMYGTFVDETGFSNICEKAGYLISEAHSRNLKVICYLNALEVMTHNARRNPLVKTLYRTHPDWIQKNIRGKAMVWTGIKNGWITRDMEDAWASPYSGFRELFKRRVQALGRKGLDAVYLDQASLPGMQDRGKAWASSDAGFAAAFYSKYGFPLPRRPKWHSPAWRSFVYFRHEAVQEYLADLAHTSRTNGIIPFFESSANDTREGTLLGNDPAISVMAGCAFSPEIEPEGDYFTAFRMAKFARDIRQDLPILFLGWPEDMEDARKEFAVALCQSGNYYPTADSPFPPETFPFMDTTCAHILSNRVPYHTIALLYSVRNKDWSFRSKSTFRAYQKAFAVLAEQHLPFRILALETMTPTNLTGISTVVLPGIKSLSDAEAVLLDSYAIACVGRKTGSRDEAYEKRSAPVQFSSIIDIDSLSAALPFSIDAPSGTWIEFYLDRIDSNHFFLFCFSPKIKGSMVVSSSDPMMVTVHAPGTSTYSLNGTHLTVDIRTYLVVIDLVFQ